MTDQQRLTFEIQAILATYVRQGLEKEMQKDAAGQTIRSLASTMEELGETAMLAVIDAFTVDNCMSVSDTYFSGKAIETARRVFK